MSRTRYFALWTLATLGAAQAVAADIELSVLTVLKAGTPNYREPPTIFVTGQDGRYQRVQNKRLKFHALSRVEFSSRFERLFRDSDGGGLELEVNGGDPVNVNRIVRLSALGQSRYDAVVRESWQLHELMFEYQNPKPDSVAAQVRDPVALCNDLLRGKSGAARQKMLREGASFGLSDAYELNAHATIFTLRRGGQFTEKQGVTANRPLGVNVSCQNLEGPAPRTEVRTTGATPRPGRPLSENSAITDVSLQIEASKQRIESSAGQSCPKFLQLTGRVTAKRAFTGRSIIFGSGFLTPLNPLYFDNGGQRAVVATYMINWDSGEAPDGKAVRAVGDAARTMQSRDFELQMNVVDAEGEVEASSGREKIRLTCQPLRLPPGPPTAPDPGGLAAAPQTGDFDARIRKFERGGVQAMRVWVYNSGPESARSCRVVLRRELEGQLSEAAHDLGDIGVGATLDHTFPLPRPVQDYTALLAEVRCEGESIALLENNRTALVPSGN